MKAEPITVTQYLQQLWKYALSPFLSDLAWYIIKFSVKVYAIMFLYNLIAPTFSPGVVQLLYGQAFVATALVTLLLTNLDPYAKARNFNLININQTLWKLINNQAMQNNGTLSYLHDIHKAVVPPDKKGEPDPIVLPTNTKVDSNSNTDYNTEESEKTE